MSIFAGAISDRCDKKKTMLVCDVLPALIIPRKGSGVLGIVTSCSGIAMVLGSLIASVMPKPKLGYLMIQIFQVSDGLT